MRQRTRTRIMVGILLVLLGLLLATWTLRPDVLRGPEARPASPAVVVSGVGKETINVDARVYKPPAKKRVRLPAPIADDPTQHVTATTLIDVDDYPNLVTSVLDDQTGETTMYVTQQPRPWLDFRQRTSIGAYAGVKGVAPAVRIDIRHEFMQIKAVRLEAIAAADVKQDGFDGFVGVGGRW